MRAKSLALFLLVAGTGLCQEYSYLAEYRTSTFGVGAIPDIALKLAVLQIRNSPHEWTRDFDGFGKRAASVGASHLISNTVQYSVASLRHEQVKYQRAGKTGIWPRLEHALVSVVVTRNIDSGERTIALGRISGAYATGLISRTWQPERLQTVQSGISSGTVSLGLTALKNVMREFWPDIRHRKQNQAAITAGLAELPEDPRISAAPRLVSTAGGGR